MNSNFTDAQLAELQNYFRQLDGHFEIASGQETVGHGKGEYCLTTDTNQGIHIYEQGNMKISSNLTMELYTGHEGDKNTGKILIRCMNGDVHIEAPNGDLVLQGKNVLINATDGAGYVSVNSPKNIQMSAPYVGSEGDHVNISGSMGVSVLGSYCTVHGENDATVTKGTDEILDGSLIQKIIGVIEQVKKFFKSICGG